MTVPLSPPPLLLDTTMFWSATGGGVRRYLLTKRRWLRTQGLPWRHAIAAPGIDAERGAVLGPEDIDLGGLPLSDGYRLPWRRGAGARAIAALRPDVIEAGDPYRPAWSALDAAQHLGVPAVAFCHSNLGAMAQRLAGGHGRAAAWARRTAQSYLRHVYREFDLVLAPSRSVAQLLRGLGLANVRQQPLGVDTGVFRPQPPDPGLRQRLGLRPDARLLLYAGRFAPEKNLPTLVEAVGRLGAPYVLLAVGAGPVALPHGGAVRVLPFEADEAALARLCASVDAFVHAGDQETFGLAALEAMACGTPVIARQRAGLAELVEGEAGLGVEAGTSAAWAEAIAALFETDRAPWRQRALARAQSYRWERVLPQLFGHYDSLLAQRAAARARGSEPTEPSVAWRAAKSPSP